jgi:hypothetical protein
MAAVHKFSENRQAIQKPWIQKRDIKEVQNLKYKHSLDVVPHMI